MGVKAGAAALLLVAIASRVSFPQAFSGETMPGLVFQKTVKDGLYSAEQATRGAELYVKHCERCHTPEKVPAGKKPGPPIVGDKFLDTWRDRTVGELFDTILNTMPSDGSLTLTAEQALDSTAHILKANGFPTGKAPMKNDDAMKSALIVK
jgi:mono/diheme cytochrome c family protein